jgi:hypothetical protein
MNNYYNTNKESGDILLKSNIKAQTQEDEIFDIFRSKVKLSASEAWNLYSKKECTPITSIRRAITNLCNEVKLIKTEETICGIYGKMEHVYRVRDYRMINQEKQIKLL